MRMRDKINHLEKIIKQYDKRDQQIIDTFYDHLTKLWTLEQEYAKTVDQIMLLFDPIKHQSIKLPKGIHKHGNKYRATYTRDGKTVYAGLRDTVEAAIKAREEKINSLK